MIFLLSCIDENEKPASAIGIEIMNSKRKFDWLPFQY